MERDAYGRSAGSRLGQPRSVIIDGRRTSLRLEGTIWLGLDEIAREHGRSIDELVTVIDQGRAKDRSLASAVRIFVGEFWRDRGTVR
jgi:predicted DNA-binding ribbon-helix-helix protein